MDDVCGEGFWRYIWGKWIYCCEKRIKGEFLVKSMLKVVFFWINYCGSIDRLIKIKIKILWEDCDIWKSRSVFE